MLKYRGDKNNNNKGKVGLKIKVGKKGDCADSVAFKKLGVLKSVLFLALFKKLAILNFILFSAFFLALFAFKFFNFVLK